MASTSFAAPATALQTQFTRMVRALGGWSAATPVTTAEEDWFDAETEAPAASDEDMATARDRSCRANYPLGVTG